MFRNQLFSLIKNVIDKVQDNNRKDENVKTADASVFKNLKTRVEETEKQAAKDTMTRADLYDILRNHVDNTRVENRNHPDIETADASVFENLMKEIEELKKKVEEKEPTEADSNPTVDHSADVANAPRASSAGQEAMTNSFGGSIRLRLKPDMSSPVNVVRIPDNSLLRVVEYSDHTIILDDKEVRWAKVEFDGQRGWVPESYLNFN